MRRFSEMRTEQLKKTMEEEIRKSNPERSTVMECLQELKRREPEGTPDKVLEAWEASQQFKARPAAKGWGKIAAAAAVLVMLLLATIPRVCGEENVFQMVGRWTKELFSFSEIHKREFVYKTDHSGLQELYDTVTALGTEKNVVPTWLPNGYKLEQLETLKRPDNTTVIANFSSDEHQIIINIMIYASMRDTEYQKGSESVEVFEMREIKHYIVENNETWTAAWSVDNMECFISASTKENLKQILLSIYKSEVLL